MQVSVEKTSELSRKMTVSIPDAVVQEKMETRFMALAREVKVAGFRPGKVPTKIVKKLYSEKVRSEVAGDLIQSTYFEALQQQQLTPAGYPHIQPIGDGSNLEYIAEFEVYPEILLDKLDQLQINRFLSEVTENDINDMIEKLKQQKKNWKEVERNSQQADMLTINFTGVVDGETFTNGKVENFKLEIGAKQMIPGFEDAMLGLAKAEQKTFTLVFPETYNNVKLAGKPAEFEVEVVKIEEAVLPDVDAEFIKSYGVESGDYTEFLADVKINMDRELVQGLKTKLKNEVLDALIQSIEVTSPKALVDQEMQTILAPYAEQAKQKHMKLEDIDVPVELIESQAKRRVGLGLIIAEIIKKNDIQVDPASVRSVIEDLSKSYENPNEVINWYYSDANRLKDVQQMVLEDKAIEWVVTQAKITEINVGFSQVMENQEIGA